MWFFLLLPVVLFLWARYAEPYLLRTTYLFPHFSLGKKLRIVQLSDLHAYPGIGQGYLKRIEKKVAALQPDLIVITGDFLCWGKTDRLESLKAFLKNLQAPYGVFAVLGNHDYFPSLSINHLGEYDVEVIEAARFPILKIITRFFSTAPLKKEATAAALTTRPSEELLAMLKDADIRLLDNETVQVGSFFNLTGVGEYMGGHADLDKAFQNFDPKLKGILLAHNPDVFPKALAKPCELVLSGHTHGGQLNLPWLWRKFTLIEFPEYKQGFFSKNGEQLYVSRGLGSAVPLRLNAIPEIVCIDLQEGK
jgi:predicted MPP superfamily phosphohydrolase